VFLCGGLNLASFIYVLSGNLVGSAISLTEAHAVLNAGVAAATTKGLKASIAVVYRSILCFAPNQLRLHD
jgi:hypothetical protein